MIGSAPVFVGYDDGGTLAEKIRRRPYQVVLLDEVEKAHPDVLNVLLHAMDDGRLTDGQRRTADFRHPILIRTSNRGAEALLALGEDEDVGNARGEVMDSVRRAFRPEFLNRLDDVLIFRRLGREQMERIVEIQLLRVNERLAERGLSLVADEAARHRLADLGWDPAFGARPLKRTIQGLVEDPISERLLDAPEDGERRVMSLTVVDGRLALDGEIVEEDRPLGFKAPERPPIGFALAGDGCQAAPRCTERERALPMLQMQLVSGAPGEPDSGDWEALCDTPGPNTLVAALFRELAAGTSGRLARAKRQLLAALFGKRVPGLPGQSSAEVSEDDTHRVHTIWLGSDAFGVRVTESEPVVSTMFPMYCRWETFGLPGNDADLGFQARLCRPAWLRRFPP